MPREELKSRVGKAGAWFNQLLERAVREGHIRVSPTTVSLPDHEIKLSDEQRRAIEGVLAEFRANPFAPPSFGQVEQTLGSELLLALIEEGRLIKVSDDVLFDAQAYAEMERRVVSHLKERGSITVAEVRDLLGTSRKYALGLLEELDRRRVTKRIGDARVLR